MPFDETLHALFALPEDVKNAKKNLISKKKENYTKKKFQKNFVKNCSHKNFSKKKFQKKNWTLAGTVGVTQQILKVFQLEKKSEQCSLDFSVLNSSSRNDARAILQQRRFCKQKPKGQTRNYGKKGIRKLKTPFGSWFAQLL